jgi:FixJ family two-component response regulator
MDHSGRGGVSDQHSRTRPLVCIVDDDRSVRLALSTLLRSVGFDVHACTGGAELLQSGVAARGDCLIADIRMPGMDGFELQQALHAAGTGLPIVFISGHADDDARERAMAAGAVGLLSKPFSEADLLQAVRTALEHGNR